MLTFNKNRLHLSPLNTLQIEAENGAYHHCPYTGHNSPKQPYIQGGRVAPSGNHTSAINLPWLQKPSPQVPMYSLPGE